MSREDHLVPKRVYKTAAEFEAVDFVLGEGVIGVETDTDKRKYGNGLTPWSRVGYAADPGSSGSGGGSGLVIPTETQVNQMAMIAIAGYPETGEGTVYQSLRTSISVNQPSVTLSPVASGLYTVQLELQSGPAFEAGDEAEISWSLGNFAGKLNPNSRITHFSVPLSDEIMFNGVFEGISADYYAAHPGGQLALTLKAIPVLINAS